MTKTLPPQDQRPRCTTEGCDRPRQFMGRWTRQGEPQWRLWCSHCHNKKTAARHGLTSIAEITAQRRGFDSAQDYKNSYHPYRKYRKDHCENKNGSVLGYPCTHEIRHKGQLQVDHKDGDPYNNDPSNLQTLCLMCHYEKTMRCGDYRTPGRKTRKTRGIFTELFSLE